jgi:ankyrin repeat protein
MRSLLDAGVDIEVRDRIREESTLQMAARLGRLDCVKLLLDRGANTQALNVSHKNALQLAEAGGHVEVAELLRQHTS